MAEAFILPSAEIHLSQSVVSKLSRTELGRQMIGADSAIADRVKLDPDDADRIWIGVRKTAITKYAMRTLHCSIDDDTFDILGNAMNTKSVYTLAAFAQRLFDCFDRGRKQCPFIQEPTE